MGKQESAQDPGGPLPARIVQGQPEFSAGKQNQCQSQDRAPFNPTALAWAKPSEMEVL